MNPRLLALILLMLLSQGIAFAVSPLVTDDADTVEARQAAAQLRFPVCPDELNLVIFSTDQPGFGLDSSSRARRNIRLSAARWFRVDPDHRRCR
jgi:hypothetical protein